MTPPLTWITDRLPTEADGDEDGDVVALCDGDKAWFRSHWRNVDPGQPWIPFTPPAAAPEPATPTSQPRRIVSIALDADSVAAVADDGTSWWLNGNGTWTQLPALPDRK